MATKVPLARRRRPAVRSLSPKEARAYLANPNRRGNKEEFLNAVVGSMTVEEADAMEARINAWNEWPDGKPDELPRP